jgi:hypothetical protein
MAVKRIRVSTINLLGPTIILVIALFALQYGNTFLAVVGGILGVATWVIGACTVRVIWREKKPEQNASAPDREVMAEKRSS